MTNQERSNRQFRFDEETVVVDAELDHAQVAIFRAGSRSCDVFTVSGRGAGARARAPDSSPKRDRVASPTVPFRGKRAPIGLLT